MADESKTSSVVGDVTRAIHDAWEFFLPATIRISVAGAIVVWLGGGELLTRAVLGLSSILGSHRLQALPALLEQYKLTPVVPIITLFVLAAFAYVFTRLATGLGFLVPVQFTYSGTILLLKKCPGHLVWYRMPEVDSPDGLIQAIEFELAKAKAAAQESVLSGVDVWSKHTNEYFGQVEATKFFLLWSVAFAIILPHLITIHVRVGPRLLLLILLLSIWGFMNLIRAAYAIEQTTHAKITAVVALLTLEGRGEISADDERRTKIEERIHGVDVENHGWWWIKIGSFAWWRSLKDMDNFRIRRRRLPRWMRR